MNGLRITAVLVLLGGYLVAVLSQDNPAVDLLGLAVPVWLAMEACWRLLEPRH
jgi:hypothetical protein